jgi:hypothetical protein
VEDCIYQTKETHAFALADKLLGDLETHPAAKRVPCEKIGSARLHSSDFGDVIGSHRFNRAGDAMLSIQWWRLQAIYRAVALKILKQMAESQHRVDVSGAHKEKR